MLIWGSKTSLSGGGVVTSFSSLNCRMISSGCKMDVFFLQQEVHIFLLCSKFHIPFHYGCTKYFLAGGGLHGKPTSFVAMCAQIFPLLTENSPHTYPPFIPPPVHHAKPWVGNFHVFSGKVPENGFRKIDLITRYLAFLTVQSRGSVKLCCELFFLEYHILRNFVTPKIIHTFSPCLYLGIKNFLECVIRE